MSETSIFSLLAAQEALKIAQARVEQWRTWAGFVFLSGDERTGTDKELQLRVCASNDAQIEPLKRRYNEIEAQLATVTAEKAQAEADNTLLAQKLQGLGAEVARMKSPALEAYMEAETATERGAAFLRLYATKIREGTDLAWDIPNTRARTLEGIAQSIDALTVERDEARTERDKLLDTHVPIERMLHYQNQAKALEVRCDALQQEKTTLEEALLDAASVALDLRARVTAFEEAIHVMVQYRRRVGELGFQLEKFDDYLSAAEQLLTQPTTEARS